VSEFAANPNLKSLNGINYNNATELLMRDLLPNGMLGVAIAGLLAAFMAGMAANISSFNTVFTYDIWQPYIRKNRPDGYYLRIGRVVTVVGCVVAIATAFIASGYGNVMNYLQTLFSFFNALSSASSTGRIFTPALRSLLTSKTQFERGVFAALR